VLAIGSHLRNIDEAESNYEIDLARTLHRNRAVYLPVLVSKSNRGERSVFKLDIDISVQRFGPRETIYFLYKLILVSFNQRFKELRNFYALVSIEERAT
jgi:hypothetical protein